ncbi:MAG: hypothetical protein J5620_03765 [Alphaproteobacteria bacterium]|nr:hypothetical protein [Alphaproteobacteria bacterium]
MNKKQKIFMLAGLMALAAACKKQPIPEPNPTPTPNVPTDTIVPPTPGDTITPVTPGDTIVPIPPMDTVRLMIKINNATGEISYPAMDTIRKYLHMDKIVVLDWRVPPNLTNGWTPIGFSIVKDTLRPRFALSFNVIGDGKIYVNKNYGGASIPCADSLNISKLGMTECDSAVYAGWGFVPYVKYSKLREDHFKMLNAIGMHRAILGKTR